MGGTKKKQKSPNIAIVDVNKETNNSNIATDIIDANKRADNPGKGTDTEDRDEKADNSKKAQKQ